MNWPLLHQTWTQRLCGSSLAAAGPDRGHQQPPATSQLFVRSVTKHYTALEPRIKAEEVLSYKTNTVHALISFLWCLPWYLHLLPLCNFFPRIALLSDTGSKLSFTWSIMSGSWLYGLPINQQWYGEKLNSTFYLYINKIKHYLTIVL